MDELNPISTMLVTSSSTIKSSFLSLPSPLASISPNWIYHVFPSFHGPDVRKAFLSHILQSFKSNGIEPFIDNAIERSKSIGPELIEAIRGSRIAIVLLSKNYASSSWCLDELVEIMRCREVMGQIVITIFYKVQPTDIRKQTGDFGETFRKTCKGKTKKHIKRWRKALENVAGIAGMNSSSWDNEAVMIEKITTEVLDKLRNFSPPRDFKDLVGMRAHMEELEKLLCLDLDEVRMIGIWGPPGIGKTTIARFLYYQISSRFQLDAIMVNIKVNYPRPCLNEYGAQVQLQHQMLSQMINKKVSNLELALNQLKDKKVLLVLDDVDRIAQLDALAKEIGWFGSGSRIIITTEDLRVLNAHRINHIYKVKYPSSEEAFQIFCMHAFGKDYPDDGFYELACQVTYLAGELPLGLKVLGSALRGMSKQEWIIEMPTLENCLNGGVESIIKFSYDALSSEEKDLFLYIACIFNFINTAYEVEEFLAKKFSNVRKSLHVLVEKSFISIDEYGIEIQTLLQQFGRETSRKQYVHGIAKRKLLVDARDICDDTIDSSMFIGIKLNFSTWYTSDEELNISEKAVERMSNLEFVDIIHHDDGVAICERLFSLLYHSQKIRYLKWGYFKKRCLPSTFNPGYLVGLDMYESNLEKLWKGNKPLKSLKWMDLSYSTHLKEVPDLSTATNLQTLNISNCSSLKNLVSLPQLSDSLTYIFADDCSSLERLDCFFNNPEICLIFTNCFKLNQKARDLIMNMTSTHGYAVLPGTLLPTCFNYRSIGGGPLTIKLNETSLLTSFRFKACIILEQIRFDGSSYETINIMVKNKRFKIFDPETEHIYTFEVEVSEVTSTELVFEFKTDSSDWKVGECGLLQIKEVPIKGGKIGENEPEIIPQSIISEMASMKGWETEDRKRE